MGSVGAEGPGTACGCTVDGSVEILESVAIEGLR
jgi:hypothetical protein